MIPSMSTTQPFSILRPANDALCQLLPTFSNETCQWPRKNLSPLLACRQLLDLSFLFFYHDIHWQRRSSHGLKFVNFPDYAHREPIVRDNQILVVSVRDSKKEIAYGFDHKFSTMKVTPYNLTSFLEKARFYCQWESDLNTSVDSEVAKTVTL
jgi:hypothetical protein